jgi:hypothetical protein
MFSWIISFLCLEKKKSVIENPLVTFVLPEKVYPYECTLMIVISK